MPTSVCVDAPISLNLLPTPGINLAAAGVTVTASTTSGTLAIGVLGPDGALTINGGQLTVGEDQPVTITVNLNGTPVASATVLIDVVQPAIPNQPPAGSLTATVGSVLSVSGLCPTGTLVNLSNLTDQTGIITIPTTSAGVQSLSILCNDSGCLSPVRIIEATVLPLLFNVLSNEPVCLNEPLSLTVIPGNFNLFDPNQLVSISVTGPAGLTVTALDQNGVLTVTGLASGVNNLSVVASIAGNPVATVGITATAYPVPDPVATASLTVLEGTTLSLTALCPTATVSTNIGGIISPLLELPPASAGIQVLPLLCAGQGDCVSPITSVTVITVPVPVPPIGINPSSLSICVGDPLSLTVTGLESITGPFGLSLVGGGTATVDVLNNVLTINGLPTGTVTLTVNAGLTVAGIPVIASQTVTVTVFGVPTAPTVATSGGASSLSVTQGSPDVLFNASCSTGTLSYTSNSGVVGSTSPITVPTSSTGVFSFSAVCINGACVSPTTVASVTVVAPANQAPVVVTPIPDQTGTVGTPFTYTIPANTFSDPESGSLTVSVANLPPGLSFDPATGVISGTPSTTVGSPFSVTVTATDPQGASVSDVFVFTINPAANQAPVVVTPIPDQTGTVGTPFTYTIPANTFSDPESGSLTVSVANLPPGLSFDPATGVISGTPSTTVGSPFSVTVTATDPQGASVTDVFVFTVNPAAPAPNQAPVVVTPIPDQTGTVGTPFTYTIPANTFSDPESGSLTVSVANLPPGLSFDPATGVISGTPSTTVGSPFSVTVTATDPQGASVTDVFVFTVNPAAPAPNQAPVVVTPIPDQTGTVGTPFTYTIPANTFSDPESGSLTVSVANLPPGLSFDPATGVISGTPSTTVGSPFSVTVTATDPQGASVTDVFVFTINPAANQAPVVVTPIPDQTGTVGTPFTYTIPANTFSDPESGSLTVSVANLPPGLSFDPATGVISGTPSTTVGSPFSVTVTATDPQGASVTDVFVFTINPAANQAPVVVTPIPDQTGTVGTPFTYTIPANTFSDPESGSLTVSVANLPPGLSFDPATGVISGTPSTTVGSPFSVTVTATDPQGASVTDVFVFTVNPAAPAPNQAPVVVTPIPDQTGTVGTPFTYTIPANTFSDPESGSLTVSVANLPPGLSFDPATGVISGTPSTTVGSPFSVTVTATDPQGASVTDVFVFTVNPAAPAPNQAPVVVTPIPDQTGTVGTPFTYTIPANTFSDPESGSLTVSVANLPPGLSFDPATGVISGTPSTTVGSPFSVTVTATDPQGASVTDVFVFTVNPAAPAPNQAPVVVTPIPDQTGTVGTPFTYTIPANTFSDPESGSLTVSVANLPPGLSFDPATGVISGTPSTTVGSPFSVTVTATDPQGASVSDVFVFTVNPAAPAPNQAPVVVTPIPDQTGTVGTPFTYTIPANTFSDPESGSLTVSVANLPPGLSFDPATGVISGTPSTTVGSPFSVTVTATDPQGASVTDVFVFTINPAANQAPVVVTPIPDQTGTVGTPFTYTIPANTFSDPESGSLTVSVANLPPGLSFDPATGVISGTPSTTVGSPFSVTVTATDPQGASVTDVFVFTVNPAAPAPNQAPVVVTPIPDQTGTVGTPFTYTIPANTFSDPESGSLTVSVANLPPGLSFDPATGVISGTPSTTVGSPFSVTVTATDPQGASVSDVFVFTVNPAAPAPNQAPVVVTPIPDQTGTVGTPFTYTIPANTFSDPESGSLTVSVANLPPGLSFDPATGVISGTPSTTVGSPFSVTVTATDPQGASVTDVFVFTINPAANQAPVVVTPIPDQTGTVGTPFTYTIPANTFSDPESGSLTVSVANLPPGLSFDPATGVISGTPSTTVGSPFSVTVTATDPQGASVSDVFVFTINPAANQAPVVVTPIPDQTGTVGTPFTYTIPANTFSDPESGSLTVSVANLPPGLSFDPATGVISGTPSTTVGSPFSVTVTATDPQGASVSDVFVFTVNPAASVNNPPTLTGTPITSPQTATVGVGYSTTTAAAFTDTDALTYTAGPLPTGVTIDPITGVISGVPSTTVGSPFTVTVTATDTGDNSVSTTYTLVVVGPTVSVCGSSNLNGSPLTATAPVVDCAQVTTTGAIQFTGTGGSPTGGPVEFKAIGVTDWTTNCNVNIDRDSRTACDAPPIEIQIRQLVNGAYVYGTSYIFNIRQQCPIQGCGQIQPGNRPPVVNAGIPDQVTTVGATFDYDVPQNAFSDPDGDHLLYTSTRLPSSFTFSSGHFHALPQVAETISVTVTAFDNNGGSVATSFNIIVNPAGTAPTNPSPSVCGSSNLNGSPLTATAPVVDCAQVTTTGAIQFTGTGGSPTGGPVEFKAIGVTDWTTNCNVNIDRDSRTACDAPPIEIQIRQLVNGAYVYGTSYIFNIRQQCPIQGCGQIQPGNRPPVVNAGIPDQVTTVGATFDYDVPQNAFSDPDGDHLLYTSTRLPSSFTFSSGHFHALPQVAETISVTVTAFDNNGGSVATTFNIIVNPAGTAPTNPSPSVCGSSNLNGSPLTATAPVVDCAQVTTTGAIQFTGTGGSPTGGPVEFKAIGVTDWTTNCNVNIDRDSRTACDAPPIEIQIRQLVNGAYVYGTSYIFNIRQQCPIQGCMAARIGAAPEVTEKPLDVRVLGNPTQEETVSVEIRGVEGKALRLLMVNAQGYTVSEQTVESADAVERRKIQLGHTAGMYFLRVSTQMQSKTVKVIKQ